MCSFAVGDLAGFCMPQWGSLRFGPACGLAKSMWCGFIGVAVCPRVHGALAHAGRPGVAPASAQYAAASVRRFPGASGALDGVPRESAYARPRAHAMALWRHGAMAYGYMGA